MPAAGNVRKTRKKGRQNTSGNWKTRRKWRQMEKVGMRPTMSIDDLNLNWVKKKIPDYNYKGAVVSMEIARTIEGATTITVVLRDPDSKMFGPFRGHMRDEIIPRKKRKPEKVDEGWDQIDAPSLIGRAVDLELDGVVFRLVQIKYNYAKEEITLIFEDRVIYWLRLKGGLNGPGRSASPKKVTRAQFILSLLREIKAEKVPFVCPELYVRQPVAKLPEEEKNDDNQSFQVRTGKRNLTIKGAVATPEQRRVMQKVIGEARDTDGASPRSIQACIAAVIVESLAKNVPGGDRDSVGVLQIRKFMHPWVDPTDIGASVSAFMNRGFTGAGGANKLAQDHPNKSIGWIAQTVQGSAYPERYDQYAREAIEWFEAATGLEINVTGEGGTYAKREKYTRDKDEDSWTAMKRLADEVNWRVFMVGRSMYYMSEPQLYQRRVRYVVRKGDLSLIDLNYSIDWSRATVNEATIQVNLDRWGAPPGSVIMLDGFGAPDGRWLVVDMRRDWFKPTAEITLRQPRREKKEPVEAAQREGVPGTEGSGRTSGNRLVDACREIHRQNLPYVWGGGHARLGHPDGGTGRDPGIGYDCSGAVGAALAKANMGLRVGQPGLHSSAFVGWGRAGRGDTFTVCYNNGHVYIRFESGAGIEATRFDTSSWGSGGDGAEMRYSEGPPNDSGYGLRHWPGL